MSARERLDEFEGCFAMTAVPSFAAKPIASLRALLDLHHEDPARLRCNYCWQRWPCPTVQAIEEHIK
jgi:hypothetical protein